MMRRLLVPLVVAAALGAGTAPASAHCLVNAAADCYGHCAVNAGASCGSGERCWVNAAGTCVSHVFVLCEFEQECIGVD